jgi:osmotically-inducible protein OsmY
MKTDSQLQQPVIADIDWIPSVNAAQHLSGVKGQGQRTDADIAHAAENMLKWWTYLPTGTVKVKVDRGWITLSGEVEWDYQRWAATDAIQHLLGVAGVTEEITIRPAASLSAVKSEMAPASHSAWAIPGLRNVVDNIQIAF